MRLIARIYTDGMLVARYSSPIRVSLLAYTAQRSILRTVHSASDQTRLAGVQPVRVSLSVTDVGAKHPNTATPKSNYDKTKDYTS